MRAAMAVARRNVRTQRSTFADIVLRHRLGCAGPSHRCRHLSQGRVVAQVALSLGPYPVASGRSPGEVAEDIPLNMSIDTYPHQQEVASPQVLVARSFSRWESGITRRKLTEVLQC